VRLRAIGDLIAHPRSEGELAAVRKFRLELAGKAKHYMALLAPVVGTILRRILDHANADGAELSCAPSSDSRLTAVFRRVHCGPIGRSEWNVGQYHRTLCAGRDGWMNSA